MKTITVKVTEKDIKEGRRAQEAGEENVTSCPVALACKRALKDPNASWGYSTGGTSKLRCNAVNASLTASWVDAFDAKQAVRPFKFRMEVREK